MGNIYHEWNGTVLTITSDSGTSSCDLKGQTGEIGARGPQSEPGFLLDANGNPTTLDTINESLETINNALEDKLDKVTPNAIVLYGTTADGKQTTYVVGVSASSYSIARRDGNGRLESVSPVSGNDVATYDWTMGLIDELKENINALEERIAELESGSGDSDREYYVLMGDNEWITITQEQLDNEEYDVYVDSCPECLETLCAEGSLGETTGNCPYCDAALKFDDMTGAFESCILYYYLDSNGNWITVTEEEKEDDMGEYGEFWDSCPECGEELGFRDELGTYNVECPYCEAALTLSGGIFELRE